MATSHELLDMFRERKQLDPKEIDNIRYVDFWLTEKQANWLEGVRAKELGYPRYSSYGPNRSMIGGQDWALYREYNKAGRVRMTLDGSDVREILGPGVDLVRFK